MKRILCLGVFVGLVSCGLCGCDSGGPKNVMEDVDQSALEEYERLIEADNAAMSADDDSVEE